MENLEDELGFSTDATQVGVVNFGSKASVAVELGEHQNLEDFIEEIQDLERKRGSSNTSGGIWVVKDILFPAGHRAGHKKACILVTDAPSNTDNHNVPQYSQDAKNDNIEMIVIGVTAAALNNPSELYTIASSVEDTFLVQDYDLLKESAAIVSKRVVDYASKYLSMHCSMCIVVTPEYSCWN